MQSTYEKAIAQILRDEGGYTNDPKDPGGPTNWGITLHDAQTYWKANATAEDVKEMPQSVADSIYLAHYANPINYNSLPAGVDYAILDYAVNSGVARALKTLHAVQDLDPSTTVNRIYDERLNFLKSLPTWNHFGKGWESRCVRGRTFALSLINDQITQLSKPNFLDWLINLFSKKG